MNRHPSNPLFVFLLPILVLCTCLTGFPATVEEPDRPIKLKGSIDIPIPSKLKSLHIDQPYAKVLIKVDEKGVITDIMPIEASHYDLLAPSLKAVRKAKFTPARMGGQAVLSQAAVYVNFFDPEQRAWRLGAGIVPFGDSVSDAAKSRFYQNAPGKFIYGSSTPKELDGPLKLREGKIRIFTSEEGVRPKGKCLVEYYVGPEGEVHFPNIIQSDHKDISMSALLTLEATLFEPPLRDGNPTCVRVRQPFNFK